jgi:hypothetical protein
MDPPVRPTSPPPPSPRFPPIPKEYVPNIPSTPIPPPFGLQLIRLVTEDPSLNHTTDTLPIPDYSFFDEVPNGGTAHDALVRLSEFFGHGFATPDNLGIPHPVWLRVANNLLLQIHAGFRRVLSHVNPDRLKDTYPL